MLESEFKAWFKNEVHARIPHVRMYEPKTWRRSAPDLIILGPDRWATIEFKRSKGSNHQPNQDYETDILDSMSWARVAFPENAEEVLHGLERLFEII